MADSPCETGVWLDSEGRPIRFGEGEKSTFLDVLLSGADQELVSQLLMDHVPERNQARVIYYYNEAVRERRATREAR